MEKLEKKHNHKLTDILKVGIFGIMLTLPFAVYCPNALYYGTNEYAVAQEKTEQLPIYYETNEVNSVDDLVDNNYYHFEMTTNDIANVPIFNFAIKEYNNLQGTPASQNQGTKLNEVPYIKRYDSIQVVYLAYEDIGNNMVSIYSYNTTFSFDFLFNWDNNTNNDVSIVISYISICHNEYLKEYQEVTYTMSIAESMDTAWKQTWDSQMFNWTNTSILKQGLDSFTGVFGVTDTSYFTNLIVYELIMVAIYIVIDIVIEMFKWLTHLIGAK